MSRPFFAGQGGFTLIELVMANALALVVAMVILGLWYFLEQEMTALLSHVRLNQEMRLVAALLREGGTLAGTTTRLAGLQDIQPNTLTPATPTSLTSGTASQVSLGSNVLRVWNNRLALIAGGNNPDTLPTLASSQVYGLVTCRGAALPHPDCTGSETLTVNGLVSAVTVEPVSRSAAGRTVELAVTLADPLPRPDSSLLQNRSRQTFRLLVAMDGQP